MKPFSKTTDTLNLGDMAFLRGHTSHWLTLDDDKPEFEMETALDVGIDDQANMEDSSPHIQEHAHNI